MVSISETTVERTAMFEAGRAHADAGLAPAYPTDHEYMDGYESSDIVVAVHAPTNESADVTLVLRPRDAKVIFRTLATSIGLGAIDEGQAFTVWHKLADAVFESGYGKTAAEMYAELPEAAREDMSEDIVREQFGLEAAALPSWFFQLPEMARAAFENAQLAASTEGSPLQ